MMADPYARLDAVYLPCVRGGTRRDPVSQGRWLVSLTRWTAANSRSCHWISLMQAEPRYSR